MIVDEEFVFQTSTILPGNKFYVANALKGDVPVDKNGYLVMVNERGDRVAFRVPGGHWENDTTAVAGYNPKIPSYTNAIVVPLPSLENE